MAKRIIGVLLLVAACAFAEDVGPASFDMSNLDASKMDLAGARFTFAAPCTFFVTGVVYDGVVYSALLEYDGVKTLKVLEASEGVADAVSSLDLSHAFLASDAKGAVVLRNVVADGYAYALDVTQAAVTPAALTLKMNSVSDSPVSTVKVVPAAGAPATSAEVEALKAALAAKDKEIAALKGGAPAAPAAATPVGQPAAFPAPIAPYGNWAPAANGIAQNDNSLLWAKYPLPVPQTANEITYRVSVKSLLAEGWIGGGVHILASGDTKADGWGYGQSGLVWLTRDPKVYGDTKTHLQFYSSTSANDMSLVTNVIVAASLNEENVLEIVVNRSAGTVTASFGGEKKLLVTSPTGLPTGDRVALRTLGGPIVFTNPSVEAK